MAKFVKGDIVVIPFPFSDLSQSKRRPALVLASLQGDDIILSQVTSKDIKDNYAISVEENDFESGSLSQLSNIRPNCLPQITASSSIV
jgi:mRNA interferase MazF